MPAPPSAPPSVAGRRGLLPADFRFGVATSGYQIEGGYNGPGEPANNWATWERMGRVEPSGNAVGFWDHPEECLDRAAAMGCDSFRLGVEWTRCQPREGSVDDGVLARYGEILDGCTARGLEPLVTLHHFTHPQWLGEELWLRPDAPGRFAAYAAEVAGALGDRARLWVTINEPNVLVLGSWLLGFFPPGRMGAAADAASAADNLLAAHVAAYDAIRRGHPDAVVTTNTASVSCYDLDRLYADVLLSRSMGVAAGELDDWIDERRRLHDHAVPAGLRERMIRSLARRSAPYGSAGRRRPAAARTRRAAEAVYASPHARTLDVVGIDYYDPMASHHLRLPGHRTAGGRNPLPARALWDDLVAPDRLTRWLGDEHRRHPGMALWIVENGMASRVRNGRAYPRLDGWSRPRYLRRHLAAVVAACDAGVPVDGYWHWSLVDNYEWGSYEPRFGIHGIDRHRGEHGYRWLDTDALGADAAGAYGRIIAGLRRGDRSVLDDDGGPPDEVAAPPR